MSNLMKRLENLSPEKRELILKKLRSQAPDALAKDKAKSLTIVPVARDRELPLSFAQERLWFLDQLGGQNTSYHMMGAVRLLGSLDITALQQSITEIICRHEILRTTFPIVNGVPIQRIAPPSEIDLVVVKLHHLSPADQLQEVQRWISQETHRSFDLAEGPLLQVSLLCLETHSYVLIITLHHIISDQWSTGIFIRELSALYAAFCQRQPSPLSALPLQYVDYAAWQRQSLQGDTLKAQLAYWRQQLQGAPPLLELPTDRPHGVTQTFEGGSHEIILSSSLTNALRTLSQQAEATLFMTLLAAFKLLLSVYTPQKDIVVGTPAAGRSHTEIEGLIGFFINTLVLRTNLADNPSFWELLARVREVALDAFAHQDIPFEKLVEELQPERTLNHNPLFQVWFNMLNLNQPAIDLPGLSVEPLPGMTGEAKFDLSLNVGEQNQQLLLTVMYNAHLFSRERIEEFGRQYKYLLQQIVAEPEKTIFSYSFITPQVQKLIQRYRFPAISNRNAGSLTHFPQAAITQSIGDRFEAQVQHYPDHIAIQTPDHQWTYSTLNHYANGIAQTLLQQCGDQPQHIALLFEQDAPMLAAILGVLKTGKAYVPLDPTYPSKRLSYMLEDAQAIAILTNHQNLALAQSLKEQNDCLINVDEIDWTQTWSNPGLIVSSSTPAYILYTSGSTGQPKGVVQTHRHVLHFIRVYTHNLQITPTDRLTLLASYSFDAAVMDIFAALLNGATLYPINIKKIGFEALAQRLIQDQITIYHSTPTLYRYFLENLPSQIRPFTLPFPDIRLVVLGGEAVVKQDVEQYKAYFADECFLVNGLGPTESTVTLQYFIDHHTQIFGNRVPVGYSVEETEVLLLNEAGNHVGVYGEIAIRSPYVALEYWQRPELNQSAFLPDPEAADRRIYRTGDLGRLRPDGAIEFLGRKDFQVKIRGIRIELGEIESALSQYPGVQQVIVEMREGRSLDPCLVAYVVPTAGATPSQVALRQYLKERLPAHMIPAFWLFLEALPLTPSGKIDRRVLPDPARLPNSENVSAPPRDELERQLMSIWRSVLGVSSIQVTDNFFDLGGHSLQAVTLFAEIEKVFGKTLPLATLFQSATIQELASLIRKEDWLAPWSSLVPLQPQGTKPPLFLIHPGGGNLLIYRDLARSLGKDQPVYGLQPMGLDGKSKILNRIEDMAAHYIAQIRSLQPEGPYYLAGLSTGGAIAWEIAQQLQHQNQPIGLLTLFDTHGPGYPELLPPIPRLLSVLGWWAIDLGKRIVRFPWRLVQGLKQAKQDLKTVKQALNENPLTPERLVQKQIQYKVQVFEEHTEHISRVEKSINYLIIFLLHYSSRPFYANTFATGLYRVALSHIPEAIQQIQTTTFAARKAYVQQVFSGRLTLFRASQRPPGIHQDLLLGWRGLATQGIDTYTIPGNHVSIVYTPELAEKLKIVLEESQNKAVFPAALNAGNDEVNPSDRETIQKV